MSNVFWYQVKLNALLCLTNKCLNFRATKGPLKQKFVQSANGINLLPLLRAARYFQGLISTGNFGSRCSAPPAHCRGAWATEGPPIKTPSGPCWPPEEHMPRIHHVEAAQSHLTLPPVCHLTLPSACVLLTLHHQRRQNKAFIYMFFFGLCWQTNLSKDESRPQAGSVWIEWETVADGGVGTWITRLGGAWRMGFIGGLDAPEN